MSANTSLPRSSDVAVIVAGAKTLASAKDKGLADFARKISAAGVVCALVCEEPRQTIDESLAAAGLADVFAARVGLDEVGWGFPAPDLFVEAAQRLKIAPWRCIVVSASPKALTAARRAACQTLGLNPAPQENETGVDTAEASSEAAVRADAAESSSEPAARTDADVTVDSLRGLTPKRLRSLFFSEAKTLYADVAVDLPVRRTYTYRVPDGLRATMRVGAMVRVPVRGRTANGVIARLSLFTRAPKQRLKAIESILSPEYAIPPDLMALGEWMTEYYLGGPGETLGAISFFGLSDEKPRTERLLALADAEKWEGVALDSPDAVATAGLSPLTSRQRQVARFFLETLNEPITRADLARCEGCSPSVIEALLAKGALVETTGTIEREDGYGKPSPNTTPLPLTEEQESAYRKILAACDAARFETFLLHGITGSGKTEIYLQAIARVLARGRQAIVLVPEISLTPQAVERFRGRFGARVGVYHSHLSRGQKYDLWRRIERGEVSVLIGARSAIFAPFADLGLIVVDEEHEHSYKQSDFPPRYHARDVAVWRGRSARIPVVLGSATPSLESFLNAEQGKFTLLELTARIGEARLPRVTLIDMGAQVREAREPSLISVPLQAAIADRLARNEQVILFLNRRGFSNFLLCMECKATVRCDHCDVVMTWHKTIGKMMCHLCGETKARPAACPACGAPDPAAIGVGTQRIEEEVRALFPRARLIRIDLDTTRGKHGFLRLWEQIEQGRADILLGTQMIAKGLHLELVTLVGVISADNALFLPDFRSAERTFAQLTQVARRAGRISRHGEVLVQTFVPHHYAIQRAVAHDAAGFYQQELHAREMLRFPPYWRLLLVRLVGEKPDRVARQAQLLGRILRDKVARGNTYRSLSVLGPVPSPIARIQDQTRWQIVLRGRGPALMRRLLDEALAAYHADPHRRGVTLVLDMDPLDLL